MMMDYIGSYRASFGLGEVQKYGKHRSTDLSDFFLGYLGKEMNRIDVHETKVRSSSLKKIVKTDGSSEKGSRTELTSRWRQWTGASRA